jgi:hypothetical protein
MLVQAFKADASVQAFDEGVVRGFTGPAEVQDDTVGISPQVELARGELAAIVHPDAPRCSERGDGLIERRHHVGCSGLTAKTVQLPPSNCNTITPKL